MGNTKFFGGVLIHWLIFIFGILISAWARERRFTLMEISGSPYRGLLYSLVAQHAKPV